MKKKKPQLQVKSHFLIPVHTKLSEKDRKELLEKHNIDILDMPKIMADDPAIAGMELKDGDIIKIERRYSSAGTSVFYRCVRNA